MGNTQIVGIDIANLIISLVAGTRTKATDFHLIGYSLGAHISGITGQKVSFNINSNNFHKFT